MRCSIFLLTSALAAFTSAASSSNITADAFYSMIPTCARACDVKALTTDGCAIDDFACHCANPEKIGRVIGPCILTQSNCTTADLSELASAVGSVCNYKNFNISASPFGGASMNSSGGHGGSWSGTGTGPSVVPYTGAASSIKSAGAGMMLIGVAAVFLL